MSGVATKILISLACAAAVYAFVCDIRIAGAARKLAQRLERERPGLWRELNPIARNFRGGQPGLKVLQRRKAVDLPGFDEDYGRLRALERKQLWALAAGAACIGLVVAGTGLWGWHW